MLIATIFKSHPPAPVDSHHRRVAAVRNAPEKRPQFHIKNRISLIGFLGQNATTYTANNASFTVLSLATKSSYKDKKTGEYKGHTEWHRCIVWGKLSEYAKTLTKGAHLAIDGELRSRERVDKKTSAKQRVWEVRVASILKLDRAEKAAPEEAEETTEDVPE
ncbi:single-stranded DNA-binding protein [Telmatobacter bradus]|uniref:single-stranded DNA-binding protein n=1 Tax=Telmatobacter bradus TaxID=474953 RepID=UPI003B43C88E